MGEPTRKGIGKERKGGGEQKKKKKGRKKRREEERRSKEFDVDRTIKSGPIDLKF